MRNTPKPTAAYIRSLRLGGWGAMKHHLVCIGVIACVDDDAPIEWQRAFCAAFGRRLTNERAAIAKATGEAA